MGRNAEMRYEFSYPWIYSPGTKNGDDSGEYNDLMGHAMNEKFHTVGYYGAEFKARAKNS